jgi:hypothetical protein
MDLWMAFWYCANSMRSAFGKKAAFNWFVITLAGLCISSEHSGVTSIIRALGLKPQCYHSLLNFFHSDAWSVSSLTSTWVAWVLRVLGGFKVNGRLVLIVDGIKIPKEGQKMPGVKSLHQESSSNAKREYIMGHFFQCVSLLYATATGAWAIPLASRIHEGLKFTNRDKRTLHNKLASLVAEILQFMPAARTYLVGDAYYACKTISSWLLSNNHHIVTRVKSNTVAHLPASPRTGGRGRPRKYGKKISLKQMFQERNRFHNHKEGDVTIKFRCLDLLWKPLGSIVRFVLVIHPSEGTWILMTTDLTLTPEEVIKLYAFRPRIEASFKQAVHTIGTYAYRFWMKSHKRIKRGMGTQHLHRQTQEYRDAVNRKVEAIERYVAIGLVAQGLMQYLSIFFAAEVWKSFRSWLRTMPSAGHPSEQSVSQALISALPELLASKRRCSALKKILTEHYDDRIAPPYMRAA